MKTTTTNDSKAAWLALLLRPGIGYVTFRHILTAANIAKAPLHELIQMPLRHRVKLVPPDYADALRVMGECRDAERRHAERLLNAVHQAGGRVITITEPAYPPLLKQALGRYAPPLLFTLGNLDLAHQPAAAVVGARNVSTHGATIARECARALSAAGAVIVSGAAAGVDTAAHQETIACGGHTIAALPQGLLTYQPPDDIAHGVKTGNVLLLSQFSPDARWETHAAVTRNASISALSHLVCVIEPRKRGGSIRTAECASLHRRPVFACVANDADSAKQRLMAYGAREMPFHLGQVDADALISAWNNELRTQALPAELF